MAATAAFFVSIFILLAFMKNLLSLIQEDRAGRQNIAASRPLEGRSLQAPPQDVECRNHRQLSKSESCSPPISMSFPPAHPLFSFFVYHPWQCRHSTLGPGAIFNLTYSSISLTDRIVVSAMHNSFSCPITLRAVPLKISII